MPVKFEFIVSDEDAQSILDAISDKAQSFNESIMSVMVDPNIDDDTTDAMINALRGHQKYVYGLIEKMHNSQVEPPRMPPPPRPTYDPNTGTILIKDGSNPTNESRR